MTDPIITKIQALLAKAESTTFEAERDAFLAKAQELMTKHAVEQWQLRQAGSVVEKPVNKLVMYSTTDANLPGKQQLLLAACRAAGCEPVLAPRTKHQQHAYVIGYEVDVDFAELLYTSLLVQCMSSAPADIRRVKSRLTDFMLGYARTVRMRIEALGAEQDAQHTGSMALALIDRSNDVKDAVGEVFPKLRTSKSVARRSDFSAQAAGGAAGQRADISGGRNNVGGSKPRGLPS